MPWKVKAFASDAKGRRFKTVMTVDNDESVEAIDEEQIRMISYWIRNMEPGERVVITRKDPE